MINSGEMGGKDIVYRMNADADITEASPKLTRRSEAGKTHHSSELKKGLGFLAPIPTSHSFLNMT